MVDSALLISFGGPTKPEEIRPFLANVAAGRRIPRERIEEVAGHYELIGGSSPLNELTFLQAERLRAVLEREGTALPVFVGMRNWRPYLRETLGEMAAKGLRRALGIILSPFQTEASWDRYKGDVAEARAAVGPAAPEVVYAPPWFDHQRFIETMADRAGAALGKVPEVERQATPIIFTAHSVPGAMADASLYVEQFTTTARLVASRIGHSRWMPAYQSRSGDPADPWLEPDIAEAIKTLAAEGSRQVVVVPIGFVCDHVEILYDLDVEAKALAEGVGVRFHRALAANDHPSFIEMLADLVRRAVSADSVRGR
jgi:ferrochelatase